MTTVIDEEQDLTADLDWEWIYDDEEESGTTPTAPAGDGSTIARRGTALGARTTSEKRKIVGARQGRFTARLGQAFLLKNDGKEPWVAMLHEFIEDEVDGEKLVSFMWFSWPKEIRTATKRRTDSLPVRCVTFRI